MQEQQECSLEARPRCLGQLVTPFCSTTRRGPCFHTPHRGAAFSHGQVAPLFQIAPIAVTSALVVLRIEMTQLFRHARLLLRAPRGLFGRVLSFLAFARYPCRLCPCRPCLCHHQEYDSCPCPLLCRCSTHVLWRGGETYRTTQSCHSDARSPEYPGGTAPRLWAYTLRGTRATSVHNSLSALMIAPTPGLS